jgi:hypothetical protein
MGQEKRFGAVGTSGAEGFLSGARGVAAADFINGLHVKSGEKLETT